jgi:hypothetical protein
VFSPPCPPVGTGAIAFESYESVVAAVGDDLVLSLEAVDVSLAYQGFQWVMVTPLNVELISAERSLEHPFDTCVEPQPVEMDLVNAYYGGCIRLETGFLELYLGRLVTVRLRCEGPGTGQIALSGDQYFETSFIHLAGTAFGGPDPRMIEVTCFDAAPPAASGRRPQL